MADNGATRILPASHRRPPTKSVVFDGGVHRIPNSEVPVANEVLALGPAGSLLLRDARLFHGAGRDTTKGPRRSAFAFYQHHFPEPEHEEPTS